MGVHAMGLVPHYRDDMGVQPYCTGCGWVGAPQYATDVERVTRDYRQHLPAVNNEGVD